MAMTQRSRVSERVQKHGDAAEAETLQWIETVTDTDGWARGEATS
jgi:hypothetical protein